MKMLKPRYFIGRLLVGLWLCATGALRAHDPGLSTAQGQFTATTLEITLGFSPTDAEQLLPPESRTSGKWTQAEFVAAQPLLSELAAQMLELKSGGAIVPPRETRVQLAAGDALNFLLVFPRPAPGTVTLSAPKLEALPPGHRQFLIILDERGSTITKKLLSAKDAAVEIPLGAVQSGTAGAAPDERAEPPTFWGFLRLGVEHIWTGY